MKKVLIITNLFPYKYSPFSEVFVQHQAEELAKRYKVHVIATRFKYRYSVELEILPSYKVTYVYLPFIRYFHLSLLILYRLLAVPVISRVVKEWKPDIIHVHDYRHVPELFLLNFCLKGFDVPRFLTLHNIRTHPVMVKSNGFRWFYGLCVRYAYKGYKHIFTVNDRIKAIIAKDAKVSSITNIGNAIGPIPKIESSAIEEFRTRLNPDCFKIIAVGNLKEEKGFGLLLEAVGRLIEQKHQIQVFIVGKGTERDRLLQQIERLGVGKYVVMTGDLNNAVVRNLYPLFDAFVLPSYSESFGIVYIEAMYAGLPVIGVKGQGIDGVVKNGENGLLVKPQDVDDLTSKIEYLIQNRDHAATMAEQGKELVSTEFQLTQLIDKIAREYEK